MKKMTWLSLLLLICLSTLSAGEPIKFNLLQLNDVYELTPLGGQGGLSRVATLKKQLLKENPNTYMLLAGDLISPSAIGLAKINGERLSGKQMIDTMNGLLDFMTFGNHEFDVKRHELEARIAESHFPWFSSNVTDTQGKAFPKVTKNAILKIKQGNQELIIGMFGLTLDVSTKDWVVFDPNYLTIAREQVAALKAKGAKVIVALTHLSLDDDMDLAESIPEIDIIMGGHEHENVQVWRGNDFTPIFKADANARSAYIHRMSYDPETEKVAVHSELKVIDAQIPNDPETEKAVQKWVSVAFESFRAQGTEPMAVVATPTVELDGREASIRNMPTELTRILTASILKQSKAHAAFINSGTMRIDDRIPAGRILNEYDVLRILPFGGYIVLTEMKGSFLFNVLETGRTNKGIGGYLQWAGAVYGEDGKWQVAGEPLDLNKTYKIAFNDFMLTGKEAGLSQLKPPQNDYKILDRKVINIRKALTLGLKDRFPTK